MADTVEKRLTRLEEQVSQLLTFMRDATTRGLKLKVAVDDLQRDLKRLKEQIRRSNNQL